MYDDDVPMLYHSDEEHMHGPDSDFSSETPDLSDEGSERGAHLGDATPESDSSEPGLPPFLFDMRNEVRPRYATHRRCRASTNTPSQEYFPLFPQICTSRLNPKLNSFPKHLWCLLVEITKYPWRDDGDWRVNVFQVKDRAGNTFVLNVAIYGREDPYTVKWDERCRVGGTVAMMQARKEEKQMEIPTEVGDYMLFGEQTTENIQVSLACCGLVPIRRSHSSRSISRAVWRDLWTSGTEWTRLQRQIQRVMCALSLRQRIVSSALWQSTARR